MPSKHTITYTCTMTVLPIGILNLKNRNKHPKGALYMVDGFAYNDAKLPPTGIFVVLSSSNLGVRVH